MLRGSTSSSKVLTFEMNQLQIHFRRFDSSLEVFNTIKKDHESGKLILTFSYHVKFRPGPVNAPVSREQEAVMYAAAEEKLRDYNCTMEAIKQIRRLIEEGTISGK